MDFELFIFFLILLILSAGAAFLFWFWRKKLSDYRTLRLGRLTFFYWTFLIIVANLIVGIVLTLPDRGQQLGLILLMVEVVILAILPIIMGIVTPIAILVLTVKMWRRESKSLANFLLPIIMIFFLIVDFIYLSIGRLPENFMWLRILSFVYPILTVYFSWQFIVFFLSSWTYGRLMKKQTAKYFVVHGAGLIGGEKVGKLLENRIRAAVNAVKSDEILILSGGKGDDEKVSEAQAMRDFAVHELNFPAAQTLLEDQSKTTYENLVFSSNLIEKLEENPEKRKFMFFSSDYHVFRAALFAAELKLDAQGGTGGKTAMYFRVPAFIREFIAVLNTQRKKHIVFVGIVVVLLFLIALVTIFMQKS